MGARHPETTAFWTGRLPHWEVENGRYFVTLHLAGAIPGVARNRLRLTADELRRTVGQGSPDWLRLQRLIFAEMERWLDRADTNMLLGRLDIVKIVVEAIKHRVDRGDWKMLEYVVMPSHLHLLCETSDRGLKAIMREFKRWTSHRVAAILGANAERFWQREWFDHWSRSDEEDERIAGYIRNNPVKAGLVEAYSDWPYGSWSQ